MLKEWDQLEIEEVWIEREDRLITEESNEERLVRMDGCGVKKDSL